MLRAWIRDGSLWRNPTLLTAKGARLYSYLRWRGKQISALPGQVVNYVLGTAYNDRILARRIRHTSGEVPLGSRVGIFTVYPVVGLQRSHLDTLVALQDAGLSPIVVSNHPISEAARRDLCAVSSVVIERPNFGYDFGAYREGTRFLRERKLRVSELVLLNDSVWFPVGPETWLSAARHSPCNFVGAVSNCGIRLSQDSSEQTMTWEYDSKHHKFHYCSFALRFDDAILDDPGFWAYWHRFRLTNDKFTTIARGEVGLSQWVLSRGYSHQSTFPVFDIARTMETKGFDELYEVTEQLVIPEDANLRREQHALLARHAQGEQFIKDEAARQLRNFILRATAETGPAYAIPAIAIQEFQYPFLKKSPIWLDEEGRRTTLDILAQYCPEEYTCEAHMLLANRGS